MSEVKFVERISRARKESYVEYATAALEYSHANPKFNNFAKELAAINQERLELQAPHNQNSRYAFDARNVAIEKCGITEEEAKKIEGQIKAAAAVNAVSKFGRALL